MPTHGGQAATAAKAAGPGERTLQRRAQRYAHEKADEQPEQDRRLAECVDHG